MCLVVFLLWFILYQTLCASWTCVAISFPMLGMFLTIIFSNIFFRCFLFLFSFWDPYNLNVGGFNVVPELCETIFNSFLFIYFCFVLLLGSHFHHSIFQLTCSFFCLTYSAIDSFQSIFHFIYCVVHHSLFFSSFRSLLNISCIFSICTSILFLRCWIIFTIITLNLFSGRLFISFSFIWACRF